MQRTEGWEEFTVVDRCNAPGAGAMHRGRGKWVAEIELLCYKAGVSEDEGLMLVEMMKEAGVELQGEEARRAEAWGRRFEEFLAQRQEHGGAKARIRAKSAWRRFLRGTGKAPWEATREDVRGWAERLATEEVKQLTAYGYTLELAMFFDLAAPEKENPARGAIGTGEADPYAKAIWLCQEEAEALLGCIDRETSVLGKRDFALLLTCVLSGQEAEKVRGLRWKAMEPDESGARVCWQRGKTLRRERLPTECWQAIRDYLEASGRMESLRDESAIFATLANPGAAMTKRAEDWADERAISIDQLCEILQHYTAWAALDIPKLHGRDLRHTAVMLRLENGASTSEIASWLGISVRAVQTSVQKLRQQRITEARLEAARRALEKGPYPRKPFGAQEGNLLNLRHGFYANRLPAEEVEKAARTPMGLEAAITNLEVIMERTLRMAMESGSVAEQMRLLEIYSQATMRLANARRIQKGIEAAGGSGIERAALEAIKRAAKGWQTDSSPPTGAGSSGNNG